MSKIDYFSHKMLEKKDINISFFIRNLKYGIKISHNFKLCKRTQDSYVSWILLNHYINIFLFKKKNLI